MKKQKYFFALFFLLVIAPIPGGNLWAYFIEEAVLPEALGRGGTGLAVPGEESGLNINPASLAEEKIEVAAKLYYTNYYGLEELVSNGGLFKYKNLGINYASNGYRSIYSESKFSFGYGAKLSTDFSAGISLKYYYLGLSKQAKDPALLSSRGNISFDLGAIYKLNKKVYSGFVFRDLNTPSIRLVKTPAYEEQISRKYGLGLAYFPREDIKMCLDYLVDEKGPFAWEKTLKLGTEVKVSHILSLRMGFEYLRFTFGLGFEIKNSNIDFAVRTSEALGNLYRVSFGYRK